MKHRKMIAALLAALCLTPLASSGQSADWAQLNTQVQQIYASGRYDEAVTVGEAALRIAERQFGPDSPPVAMTLNNLATTLMDSGHYDRAEALLPRAVLITGKALGPDAPQVAQTRNNLAELYRIQGRHAEAEAQYKPVIVSLEKSLGSDHPVVAIALNNLALSLAQQGKFDQAEPLNVYLSVFTDAEDYGETQYYYGAPVVAGRQRAQRPPQDRAVGERGRVLHQRGEERQGRPEAAQGVGLRRRALLEERAGRRPAGQGRSDHGRRGGGQDPRVQAHPGPRAEDARGLRRLHQVRQGPEGRRARRDEVPQGEHVSPLQPLRRGDPALRRHHQEQPEPRDRVLLGQHHPRQPHPHAQVRFLADSGLGVGGKFKPFDIVNCDSGDQYCQVCKFGGSPKIMAVGTIDDPAFKTDLQNLDALVQKYGEDKIKAFAVVTDIKDGKSSTPTADSEALIARAKALRSELGVKFPIVVPASEAGAPNKEFDDYYNVTKSRTVMFADGRNSVKYSAVAPKDLAELNTAIQSSPRHARRAGRPNNL